METLRTAVDVNYWFALVLDLPPSSDAIDLLSET